MTAPALVPGQVLGGRYEILATLGKGGMGVVYKAHDRVLSETVAIKVLREDVAGSPEMARRFLAEIKLARSVTHRNVCRIHEYGQDGDLRYISMAFVDGVDLKQVLRERGPLPPAEALDLAVAVADGLQAIHEEGIVHRDLKTPNLMVDGRGVVRLMDFGIAKQWNESAAAGLTGTGMIVGTPEYMSPEQVLGQKLDLRSDLYALGIVVYELLTGETPFHSETPVGLLMKHLHEPPALDSPALPSAIVPVLARALAKNREERHSSAAEMAEALREALRGINGASAPRTSPRSAPPRAPATTTRLPATFPAASTAASPVATTTPAPHSAPPSVPARRPATTVPAARPAAAVRGSTTGHGPAWTAVGAAVLLAVGVTALLLTRGRSTAPPAKPPAPASPAAQATAPPLVAPATAPASTMNAAPSQATMPPAETPVRASAPPLPRPPREGPRPEVAQEVEGLLAEAETAFAAQQHEAALEFYEQALRLDPGSQRARVGRDLCASTLARAAAAPAPPKRGFTAGRTEVAGRSGDRPGPAGFESGGGVAVRRVEQAAAPPGKLVFEVDPEAVRAGDAFTVRVYMVNEGGAVLRLAEASVSTTVDGRTASGGVNLLARDAPPRQRTLILSTGGQWRAEIESWSMAVSVLTAGGDTYRNQLAWR